MHHIVELIRSIPLFIFTALIGALSTLLGVIIANKHNSLMLEKRLEYEKNQNEYDRRMNLREQIYFPALDALSKIQEYLVLFATIDIKQNSDYFNVNGITEKLNKIEIIGNKQTIEAINKTLYEYTHSIFSLFSKKLVLTSIEDDIENVDSDIEQLKRDETRNYENLKLLGEARSQDKEKCTIIDENLAILKDIKIELLQKKDKLEEKRYNFLKNFLLECNESSIKISSLSLDAIFAIRRELGLYINEVDLKKMSEKYAESINNLYKQFFDNLENEFAN